MGSWFGGSCQAPEMSSWIQRDLFCSRWTRAYWALRLTLGRSWASVHWDPGREPGARLSRNGNQAPYSLSKALLTRSSGQPGTIWSNWASSSAFLKASDHPHCSTESVIWCPEAPVSGCSWVTWDGIDVAPSQPRPPYCLAFQWHPPERKHSPQQGRLAFHARWSMIPRFSYTPPTAASSWSPQKIDSGIVPPRSYSWQQSPLPPCSFPPSPREPFPHRPKALSSSAQAHDLDGRPLDARGDDAERPLPCHGTHDRSPGMVGDQHHRSPFE